MAAGRVGRTQGIGPGVGVAAAHQLHEFLRRRLWPLSPRCCDIAPQIPCPVAFLGYFAVRPEATLRSGRLAGLAGRGLIAKSMLSLPTTKILLKLNHNAQLSGKSFAAGGPTVSPAPMLRFTRCAGGFSARKGLNSRMASNPAVVAGVSFFSPVGEMSCEPSDSDCGCCGSDRSVFGGSATPDLPGHGTFLQQRIAIAPPGPKWPPW